jgi:hypothetical protein
MNNRIGLALVASLAIPAFLTVASPASADRPAIDEGGDRRPCVTEQEFDLVDAGGRASTVSRIFDTDGRRVGKRALARVMAQEYPELVGQGVETAPPAFRQVRRYDTCLPGFVLVEFNKHTSRVVAVYFEVSYQPGSSQSRLVR